MIGALVKIDDSRVVDFLVQIEIIPLCLRIMSSGTELSKTVATYVIQKILSDNKGLMSVSKSFFGPSKKHSPFLWFCVLTVHRFICETFDRFSAVCTVLFKMVAGQAEADKPSVRLLRHIIRCYWRLSEHPQARDTLRQSLPPLLRDPGSSPVLMETLKDDASAKKALTQLLSNLS